MMTSPIEEYLVKLSQTHQLMMPDEIGKYTVQDADEEMTSGWDLLTVFLWIVEGRTPSLLPHASVETPLRYGGCSREEMDRGEMAHIT